MSRLAKKAVAELSEEQHELYKTLTATRPPRHEGEIGGPFDAWLLNAEMGKRIVGLGNLFRFKTSVDRRYVELVILVTGAFWRAQFEWFAHEPMAREAGVPDEVINSIKAGNLPEFTDDKDRISYQLATDLHKAHQIDADTYQAAVEAFGEQGVAELVNLAGYYTMVSMTLNTFAVEIPAGEELPFK